MLVEKITQFNGVVTCFQSKDSVPKRGEYNVYSTFQSHEPEFDYLKSLEIEEKINKIRWLKRKNPAHFLLSTNGKFFSQFIKILFQSVSSELRLSLTDKTIKLWRVSERDKKIEGYNLREEDANLKDNSTISQLRVNINYLKDCNDCDFYSSRYTALCMHFCVTDTCDKTYGTNGRSFISKNIRQCSYLSY